MVTLNGVEIYEEPGSCGSCPFFNSGSSHLYHFDRGHCMMWNEFHHSYINPPRKCKKMFKKALSYPSGEKLVIVTN